MRHFFFAMAFGALLALLPCSYSNAQNQIDRLSLDIDKRLNEVDAELTKTNLRIDGINNGVLLQVGLPVIIGILTFFLGRWDNKRQMKAMSDEAIAKWLAKEGHERWDTALNAYLKANFPGRIDYLLAAAKSIAHDQELQQTKRIRVIGLDRKLSAPVVDMLRTSGFLQVEFAQFEAEMTLPDAEILILDRYSTRKEAKSLEEEDVRKILQSAKKAGKDPNFHYYGGIIEGLKVMMSERTAASTVPFSLVPNLLDQLRYVFPQPK